MSVQLRNRKAAGEQLGEYVRAAVVSPELVQAVCEAPVDERYVAHLRTLDSKVSFMRTSRHQRARASQDVAPTIERLRLKAVARVREFLLERVYALRAPKTNVQIKQNLLLRYGFFYTFLTEHGGAEHDVAAEVRQNYVDTMAKRYLAHFRAYLANLRRLQTGPVADKNDLLGTDESKTGGFFSAKKSTQHMNRVFALGQRANVLQHVGDEPIIYHVAQQASQSFAHEYTFRSAQHLLMDTATSEYAFVSEFFGADSSSHMFTHIFARTISLFLESLEDYLFGCFDTVGLLVMIRIVHRHNQIMQSRRVYCLDAFFDRVNMLLWPRFKMVLDLNVASLAGVRRQLRRGEAGAPHYVAVRYASLCAAVLSLNRGFDEEFVASSLRGLRAQVEQLLLELSASAGGGSRAQVVFLITNYETVLAALRAHDIEGEEVARFEELAAEQTTLYVEEELAEKFGRLVAFVKRTEHALGRDEAAAAAAVDEAEVRALARHFAQFWRSGIEQINASVQKTFSAAVDAAGSMEILKQCLIQLVLYYQRFQDVIGKAFDQPSLFGNDLVPVPTIMYEIKKYSARA